MFSFSAATSTLNLQINLCRRSLLVTLKAGFHQTGLAVRHVPNVQCENVFSLSFEYFYGAVRWLRGMLVLCLLISAMWVCNLFITVGFMDTQDTEGTQDYSHISTD